MTNMWKSLKQLANYWQATYPILQCDTLQSGLKTLMKSQNILDVNTGFAFKAKRESYLYLACQMKCKQQAIESKIEDSFTASY